MNNPVDVYIYCSFCAEQIKMTIDLPKDFTHVNLCSENEAFCEKHSVLDEWRDKQCRGCVGGWSDCTFTTSFRFQKMKLTKHDLDIVKTGVCPSRTNGLFSFTSVTGKIEDINISQPTQVGLDMYDAIMEYRNLYCEDK